MSKFILTDSGPLMDALLSSVGLEPSYVRRLVLDLEVGSAGRLYIEAYADDEILRVAIPAGIQIVSDHREPS